LGGFTSLGALGADVFVVFFAALVDFVDFFVDFRTGVTMTG
jgi:hypothetical protein